MGTVIQNKFEQADVLFTMTAQAKILHSDNDVTFLRMDYFYNGEKLEPVYQTIRHDQKPT